MKHDTKNEGTKLNSSLFFSTEFKVCFIILLFSIISFFITFTFDEVPPILNRGIQPATFPKILLVLIFFLTCLVYYLSFKSPWKNNEILEKPFFLTLFVLILFVLIAKFIDFFLAIGSLSLLISYFWGERNIYFLLMVSILFPIIVFIFFETILGLRFPGGILTNLYYN
tara:strand:- start:1135 stop:1641 length:507 start_codon:yes stop_codon:yes gene_type:complete